MTSIVKFRDQEIKTVIQDGVEMVPVKPICQALNLHYPSQFSKIKEDEILSQLFGLVRTTGKDKKTYKMAYLPLEFVFGWLFSISDQANDTFKKYKLECYHVLYNHFVVEPCLK